MVAGSALEILNLRKKKIFTRSGWTRAASRIRCSITVLIEKATLPWSRRVIIGDLF